MNKTTLFALSAAAVFYALAQELPRQVATQVENGGRTGFVITPDGTQTITTFADGKVTTNALKRVALPEVVSNNIERISERLIIDAARIQHEGSLTLAAESARVFLQSREAVLAVEREVEIITPPARKE